MDCGTKERTGIHTSEQTGSGEVAASFMTAQRQNGCKTQMFPFLFALQCLLAFLSTIRLPCILTTCYSSLASACCHFERCVFLIGLAAQGHTHPPLGLRWRDCGSYAHIRNMAHIQLSLFTGVLSFLCRRPHFTGSTLLLALIRTFGMAI